MKKYILVNVLLILALNAFSQYKTTLVPHSADPEIRQLIAEGTKYLYGVSGYEQDYSQALDIFKQASKDGEPVANFLLAQMYEKGLGVKKHPQKAYKYYKLAADGGEKAAMTEVGKAYKKGKGIDLDFKKAVRYFQKGSDKNSPRAQYGLGYLCFKGFGTAQDYKMAVDLFKKSAAKEFPPGVFMLGVCYEHGYGLNMDLNEARKCYEFASEHNYKQAKIRLDELNTVGTKSASTENVQLHNEFLSNKLVPVNYTTVNRFYTSDLVVSGKWEGELLIYDWSGKEIINKENISLNFSQRGYTIHADWNSDLSHYSSKGIVLGNNLNFDELNLVVEDALGAYTLKNVTNLSLIAEHTDSCTYISGSVETYLPEIKEPGPPAYIILKGKAISTEAFLGSNGVESGMEAGENMKPNFNIYPNPFENKLTIQYELVKPGSLSICLYSGDGRKIRDIKVNEFCEKGKYSVTTNVAGNPGAYIIEVMQDGERQTRKIVKH